MAKARATGGRKRASGSAGKRGAGGGASDGPPDDLQLGTEKLYFKIGEVAEIVGVAAYVLRYWETEFKAVKPQKSRTQQRVYRRRDVATLLKIKHLLYAQKFTIAGARQQLKEAPEGCTMAAPDGLYLCRQSLAHVRSLCAQMRGLLDAPGGLDRTAADPAAYVASAGGMRGIAERDRDRP
jgi:DNA-binding transcriptional MerR regulator